MAFPRYFLALCALFFFAIVVSAEVEDSRTKVNTSDSLLSRVAVAIIKKAVAWAVESCLEEAANNCKQDWDHPEELVKCGKAFLEANKGRCVAD